MKYDFCFFFAGEKCNLIFYLGIAAAVFLGVVFSLLGVRDRGVVESLGAGGAAAVAPYFFGVARRLGD